MTHTCRTIVRTALIFDGTTDETSTGYSFDPRKSFERTYKRDVEDPVGSWSAELMSNPDRKRSLVFWVRLVGLPVAGTSRVDIRSAAAGDTDAGYGPNDLLLQTIPLVTTWSGPFTLGPTDRVCPTHSDTEDAESTIEYRVMDMTDAMELGLLPPSGTPSDASCCTTSTRSITTGVTLEPWTDRRVFFVDAEDDALIRYPALGDVEAWSKAVFVRVGGGPVNLLPQEGEHQNGVVNGAVSLGGNTAVLVERSEGTSPLTWTATQRLGVGVQDVTNAVAGATVNIAAPSGDQSVRLTFTAWGFARLPVTVSTSETNEGFNITSSAASNSSQVILIPLTGQRLNGVVDGRMFIGPGQSVRVTRSGTGWLAVTDGGYMGARELTLAADGALTPWGPGELILNATQAAAQAVALPNQAVIPVCPGARLTYRAGGAGGLTLDAGALSVIYRPGGAAAQTLVVAQHAVGTLTYSAGLGGWVANRGA